MMRCGIGVHIIRLVSVFALEDATDRYLDIYLLLSSPENVPWS
jgi:hypothetical protein